MSSVQPKCNPRAACVAATPLYPPYGWHAATHTGVLAARTTRDRDRARPDAWQTKGDDTMTNNITFEAGPVNPQPQVIQFDSMARDPLSILPERGQERLRALRLKVDDLRSLCPDFDDIRAASEAKLAAERNVKRLTDHRSVGGFELAPDDPRVEIAERELEKLADQSKRLLELQSLREAAWRIASQMLSRVQQWLFDGMPRNVTLEDHSGAEPRLLNGERNILEACEARRRRVRELKADLHRIESSCYPSAYCKQRMREMIERLAQTGTPDVSSLVEFDREIGWRQARVTSLVHNAQPGAIAFAEIIDTASLIAWAFKDVLVKKLDAEIDTEKDDQAALSVEERQKRAAVVMGDLLATERQEAALIFKGWAEGISITAREDLDPVAVLNVELVVVTAPREASGTTPGYSWDLRR
jgi:hypothetical protein